MSEHTPGPWKTQTWAKERPVLLRGNGTRRVVPAGGPAIAYLPQGREDIQAANARLIEAAPEMFAEVESTYAFLADIDHRWPGRHSREGQDRLCRLRHLICKVTGRDAQDVQDDYTNRAAIARAKGGAR